MGLPAAGVFIAFWLSRRFAPGRHWQQTGVWGQSAESVRAIGDCAGRPHFTQISDRDFHIVSGNVAGANHVTTGRQVPFRTFTDPELACIGLSENEAKARGVLIA